MLGQLIPSGGGDPIPLLKPKLLVGRRSRCDITLEFPNISSHHCELELINGYWHVRDLGSRNGIKVNGQRCDSKWLVPGDELAIAKHRYEITYTPSGDAPPPQEEENPFEIGLLEKAGLAGRRPSPRPQARPPAVTPPADPAADDEESKAIRWLADPE